jgi:hypothetical protein
MSYRELVLPLCVSLTVVGCSADSESTVATSAAADTSGLAVTAALNLDHTSASAGDTVSGTITYTNASSSPYTVQAGVIAARPPGGSHGGGPYDDFQPYAGATTIPPGGTFTVTASRTFSASDPTGTWDLYPTYQDGSGAWHDGDDLSLPVGVAGPTESASCTTIGGDGQTITDASGGAWMLRGGVVLLNGQDAGYSANVTELAYVDHVVSQRNSSGGWWSWGDATWNEEMDPTGACGGSAPPVVDGGGGGGGATGSFSVANGQIVAPDGSPFIALGVDVDNSIPASQVTPMFPGMNFIRLPAGPSNSADDLRSEVESFTSAGIVVEIEDHPWPEVAPYTGGDLDTETSWYASLASAFKGNPYVWFGSMNEPQTAYGDAEAAISTQEAAIYDAIRGTGNDTVIMMSLMGGGNPGTVGAGFGMTPETYAGMHNIVWDLHFYGWSSSYSTDQGTVSAALAGSVSGGYGIAAAQTIQSADGLVPVLIGEYGDSTDGQSRDANWQQVIHAVETSGHGSAAWEVTPYGVADVLSVNGQLTDYGTIVAQYFASATGR